MWLLWCNWMIITVSTIFVSRSLVQFFKEDIWGLWWRATRELGGASTDCRAVILALPIPHWHGRSRILLHMQFSTWCRPPCTVLLTHPPPPTRSRRFYTRRNHYTKRRLLIGLEVMGLLDANGNHKGSTSLIYGLNCWTLFFKDFKCSPLKKNCTSCKMLLRRNQLTPAMISDRATRMKTKWLLLERQRRFWLRLTAALMNAVGASTASAISSSYSSASLF